MYRRIFNAIKRGKFNGKHLTLDLQENNKRKKKKKKKVRKERKER